MEEKVPFTAKYGHRNHFPKQVRAKFRSQTRGLWLNRFEGNSQNCIGTKKCWTEGCCAQRKNMFFVIRRRELVRRALHGLTLQSISTMQSLLSYIQILGPNLDMCIHDRGEERSCRGSPWRASDRKVKGHGVLGYISWSVLNSNEFLKLIVLHLIWITNKKAEIKLIAIGL